MLLNRRWLNLWHSFNHIFLNNYRSLFSGIKAVHTTISIFFKVSLISFPVFFWIPQGLLLHILLMSLNSLSLQQLKTFHLVSDLLFRCHPNISRKYNCTHPFCISYSLQSCNTSTNNKNLCSRQFQAVIIIGIALLKKKMHQLQLCIQPGLLERIIYHGLCTSYSWQ